MAAPHVAGAWAILKSKVPNASVSQVLSALTTTGVPILDIRNGITKPRIQVDAALNALTVGQAALQWRNQRHFDSRSQPWISIQKLERVRLCVRKSMHCNDD